MYMQDTFLLEFLMQPILMPLLLHSMQNSLKNFSTQNHINKMILFLLLR